MKLSDITLSERQVQALHAWLQTQADQIARRQAQARQELWKESLYQQRSERLSKIAELLARVQNVTPGMNAWDQARAAWESFCDYQSCFFDPSDIDNAFESPDDEWQEVFTHSYVHVLQADGVLQYPVLTADQARSLYSEFVNERPTVNQSDTDRFLRIWQARLDKIAELLARIHGRIDSMGHAMQARAAWESFRRYETVFNQFNVGEFFLPDDYWYPGFRDAYVQVLDAYFNKQANIPDEAIEQNWFSRLSEDEAIQEYRAFLAKQEL